MRNSSVWQRAFGLACTVVEDVGFDERRRRGGRVGAADGQGSGAVWALWASFAAAMTVARGGAGGGRWIWARRGCSWRPTRRGCAAGRMGRRWRRCRGPVTAPGTPGTSTIRRRGWRCTSPRRAVVELLRVAWRTVGAIVARVSADIDARVDRLDGLRRIGIDEISYKRGHRYLTVVVDHDSGRLVWAAPGRDDATLDRFFDELGAERAAPLTHVSADMAPTGSPESSPDRAPHAMRCADPFHVVAWAIEALDVERRRAWNEAAGRRPPTGDRPTDTGRRRRPARSNGPATRCGRTPSDLTDRQRHQLDWIAKTDPRLWRAYLLKEGLRYVFTVKGDEGKAALDRWISWARRSRLPAFVELHATHRQHTAPRSTPPSTRGLSNALIESTNTKIRLLTRIAFGFHGPEPLIALAMLALGGHPPRLPGRT